MARFGRFQSIRRDNGELNVIVEDRSLAATIRIQIKTVLKMLSSVRSCHLGQRDSCDSNINKTRATAVAPGLFKGICMLPLES